MFPAETCLNEALIVNGLKFTVGKANSAVSIVVFLAAA